jgi:uncharacterized membrane protein
MTRSSAWLRWVLVAAGAAWAAALPLATVAAARPEPSAATYLPALAVYGVGSVVCHQQEARSFHIRGRQMPVCARCTGIYAGAAIAGVMVIAGTRRRTHRRSWGRVHRWTLLAAAASPTAASLAFEWATGVTPGNSIRAATGVLLGVVVASLVTYEVN